MREKKISPKLISLALDFPPDREQLGRSGPLILGREYYREMSARTAR
jgi:hypothetical protein